MLKLQQPANTNFDSIPNQIRRYFQARPHRKLEKQIHTLEQLILSQRKPGKQEF